ncbi:hypothetical protein [Streptomyces sp. IBSBF 2806]|uniref:hypothetical protein n=1 Tax=Streptomyces sp. IBSBF 2806 TaxID=2903529 RepID=UPI002FDBCD4E
MTVDHDLPVCAIDPNTAATEQRTLATCCRPLLKGERGDQQRYQLPPHPAAGERPRPMTTTVILAMIGGITLILTAAARIPPALEEFLRACIPVATALREVHTAFRGRTPHDDSAENDDRESASSPSPPQAP